MNNAYRPPSFSFFPPVVKNLLIINGIFFLAMYVIRSTFNYDITDILGLHYFTSPYFHFYQLVTYLFMHGSLMHIFSNMFALWMFGYTLENYWGSKRFIIFYFICGIGAGLTQELTQFIYFHHIQDALVAYGQAPTKDAFEHLLNKYFAGIPDTQNITVTLSNSSAYLFSKLGQLQNIATVGASGAIFGVLLAFAILFPNTLLFLIFFPVPIKAKYFVMLYGIFELYSGIANGQGDDVAHFAHLGGMLFAFILIMYWKRKRTLY